MHTQIHVQTYANGLLFIHTHTENIVILWCVRLFFFFWFGKGHCLPLNAWVHSYIFNDGAVCSQFKRLASLRHNLMDQCGQRGRSATEAASQNSELERRIALYCVVVRPVGWLWCAHSDTLACAETYTVVHTYKQRHLSPERVSVRSAGSACGQRCIVASLQLSWTFNSASIQLLLVTQDQRAAQQPVWPTTPAFTLSHCCGQEARGAEKPPDKSTWLNMKGRWWLIRHGRVYTIHLLIIQINKGASKT